MAKPFKAGCSSPVKEVVVKKVEIKEDNNLEEEVNMVKVGRKAPNFELQGYHKGEFKSFKLEEFLGKWVVLCFYPGDFTFVWATEVSAVADKYQEFVDLGVEVLSVSVDSVFVHKMWNDKELSKMVEGGIPYPMLSDQGGNIGDMYGVYDAEGGVEMRGRFLIDPDGIIQGYEVLTPPVGRNVSETLRQVKAFQLVRETGAEEVTPSGWEPGKKTLKPGPDLVGNVWKEWNVKDSY